MSGSALRTFQDFVFDPERRELRRGNEPVHLTPKAFRLLETLIDAVPRSVAKQDLYREVWGEVFVEEANLPNLVSEIRAALGDNRESPRYIRTIHGHGYAFVAQVERPRIATGTSYFLSWRRARFDLAPGSNVVGRGEECDVVIESAAVSRRHATIRVEAGRCVIRDLGSKNGTSVDGRAVEGEIEVRVGDDIGFGTVKTTLRLARAVDTTMTEAGE